MSLAPVGLAIVALLAGCGSSKPGYCSHVNDLEQSIQALGGLNLIENGPSGVVSAVQKIESNAQAVVSDAKIEFPSEMTALTSSLETLSKSAVQLSTAPTPAPIVAVPGEIVAGAAAVKNFANATTSECG